MARENASFPFLTGLVQTSRSGKYGRPRTTRFYQGIWQHDKLQSVYLPHGGKKMRSEFVSNWLTVVGISVEGDSWCCDIKIFSLNPCVVVMKSYVAE